MELWIRSQNKHTLIKCDYITTLETNDIFGNSKKEYKIITTDDLELGEYDSEKRLLEVLDEIQNKMRSYLSEFNDSGITLKEVSTVVYEMPEN